MTLVNRKSIPPTTAVHEPNGTLHLPEVDDADRYLIGYGIPALTDVLDGMGRIGSTLNDVQAVYLPDETYDYYVLQGMWRELSPDPEENNENATTLMYMLGKGLLRRGKPKDKARQEAIWNLAVHGRRFYRM